MSCGRRQASDLGHGALVDKHPTEPIGRSCLRAHPSPLHRASPVPPLETAGQGRDQLPNSGSRGEDRYQTGLFFTDGREKLAFQAFRFPFVTERRSRKRVRAWGRSPKAGKVKIQGKKGGKWRTLERIRVREDEVFTAGLRGSKQMRAQIGGTKSIPWRR